MAKKRLIETAIWQDSWFVELCNEAQRMFLFLITSNYILESGFCEIPKFILKTYFGTNYEKTIKKLKPKVFYDENNSLFLVLNYAEKNTKSPNIIKAIYNDLLKYRKSHLFNMFKSRYSNYLIFKEMLNGLEGVSKGFIEPSNEYEYDNEYDNEEKKEKNKIYGENKKVKLTETEYGDLINKYGLALIEEYIQRLDDYIAMKGNKYKSHKATIQNWIRKANEKPKEQELKLIKFT